MWAQAVQRARWWAIVRQAMESPLARRYKQ
jgi:hypothetical protein